MPTQQPQPYNEDQNSWTAKDWYMRIQQLLASLSTSIGNIDDVTITSLGDGEVLYSSSGVWINQTKAEADIAIASRILTAGTGISGGGDLTADRSFDLDIESLTTETPVAADDFIPFFSVADEAQQKMTLVSLLNPTFPTTDVTSAAYEVTATDRYLLVDTSSNAVTVELLPAATAGDGYRLDVKLVDATNALTVDPDGSETIDEVSSVTGMGLYDNLSIVCDGSEYWIV